MIQHIEIIKLTIAYTLAGAFVFTVGITCLSLAGWLKFADKRQQQKLFSILIVELVVGCVGFFFNFLAISPHAVARDISAAAVAPHEQAQALRNLLAAHLSTLTAGEAQAVLSQLDDPKARAILTQLDATNAPSRDPRLILQQLVITANDSQELNKIATAVASVHK